MLTVFSAANRRYEMFVLPYVASVLSHEPSATVEIRMEDLESFNADNAAGIAVLREHFGDRFVFTRGDFSRLPANSVRFVETPSVISPLVYIGDIDILVVEPIAPAHLEHMARTGLPYSNIQRPGKRALSGLHFTRWDAYYPHAPVTSAKPNLDEAHLFALIQARGLPLPNPDDTFRPLHGFHLSLNRDPRQLGNQWGGVRHRPYAEAYALFRGSDLWRAVAPHFAEEYRRMLYVLEAQLAVLFPDAMKASLPTPY